MMAHGGASREEQGSKSTGSLHWERSTAAPGLAAEYPVLMLFKALWFRMQ